MEQLWVGMTGTGHYDDTDHLPKNWDQKHVQLYPHGTAKLNAILSSMKQGKATGPELGWWEDEVTPYGGAITGVYTDTGLANAYTSGTAPVGTTLYVKCAKATVLMFRPGLEIMMTELGDSRNDVVAKVLDMHENGDSSFLAVRLMVADGGGPGDLTDCDYIFSIGDINPQGSFPAVPRVKERVKKGNYLQIWQDTYSLTRTQDQSTFTSGDKKMQYRAECLNRFNEMREFGYQFGVKSVGTNADNGQPEYTTDGIVQFLKSGAPDHIRHYHLFGGSSTYKGQAWVAKGKRFLDESMEMLFHYTDGSRGKKLVLCGNGAISGLNQLAEMTGVRFNMSEVTTTFGWSIWRYRSPFGDVDFMTYPLFNLYPGFANTCMFLEPHNLKRWVLQQTKHEDVTPKGLDGAIYQFLAEDGLQVRYPKTMMLLTGIGVDNAVT